MKILVADDSKTNLAILTASLQHLGHEVIAASSGDEAIALFKKKQPDLIILDVIMKGMNGFDCAAKIRQINTEEWIPIIFLSSSVDDVSISKGINAGGDDYLAKPFSDVTLAAKIKAMQRISEMRKKLFHTTKELQILSCTDALTGLYNRFQFEHILKEKIAEADRYQYTIALMFIDLDHFKTINDNLGHHVGDLLLKEVAERLKYCLRIDDFVSRTGGDEFVVIINHVEKLNNVDEIAKKIISKVTESLILEGNNIRISASIGIAQYPHEGVTSDTLVQNADIAMYHAKELGRNNFQYYSESLNQKYRKHLSLEHELKFALERQQLYIAYQPIYNLINKNVIGMEALLRWEHPEFGVISPGIFIPIAEETGLILNIGSWAFEKACQQGAKWIMDGYENFKLSINLSLHQLLQDNFLEILKDNLQRTKFPPEQLELELTETTLISYTDHLRQVIKEINDLGIGISIDDFGTRYSSLSSLRSSFITSLKVDKEFIKDVPADEKNCIIVKSIIDLGLNLNLRVIAEGIQTHEQMQFIMQNGCNLGQGFLLSKPLLVEEMTRVLRENNKKRKQTVS